MAVALTPPAASYFLTPQLGGTQPPISTLALTSLKKMNNPKTLGVVMAQNYINDSIFAELMAMGNEIVVAGNQIMWEEQSSWSNPAIVSGAGVVTFASSTGTFAITGAAIPADATDINSERPTSAQFLQIKLGMEFAAFDDQGRKANGKITSIATDKKSFVASPIGGSWNNLGATNIMLAFTGNNLKECELAPCVGFQDYLPARETTFFKDSECVKYCDETEIANSPDGVDAEPLVKIGNEFWNVDQRLDQATELLTYKNENEFAFGRRLTVAEANGGPRGTDGVFTVLENKAVKYQGMIETKQDVINLAANLRSRRVYNASLRVSSEQYAKLLDVISDANLTYDPFKDNTNELYYIGFGGFKVGDVTIRFKTWFVLDEYPNVGKRYHWLCIPEGRVNVKLNGRMKTMGYLNIAWFGKTGDVYKYKEKRDSYVNGEGEIHIINKFAVVVLRPQDFMIGVTVAA